MYSYQILSNDYPSQLWEAYYVFIGKALDITPSAHLFYHPSFEKFKAISTRKASYVLSYPICCNNKCIGVLEYMKKAKHAYLYLLVEKNKVLVQDTFLNNMLNTVFSASTVRITTSQVLVKNTLENIGGKCVIHDVIQELPVKNLASTTLQQLVAEKEPSIIVNAIDCHFHTFLADEWLDKYITFHNTIVKDIPVLDMENGEQTTTKTELLAQYKGLKSRAGKVYYYLATNSEKNIVGVNAVWLASGANTTNMTSGLTAVATNYRGKGIAQYLKASMLQKLLSMHSNLCVLDTANSVVNAPILALNKKFGFIQSSQEFIIDYKVNA